MLSPLQERVAHIVAELPEAEGFALAGGGALIARGAIERTTRDLDYFSTRPEHVLGLLPHLVEALTHEGLEVEQQRASEGFARLVVSDGAATTELDLASDFRLLPPEPSPVGRTLAAEELAIDKVLAIFDRAEPRDFADLAAVADRWGLDHLLRRATEKDGGFSLPQFAQRLERVATFTDDEFRVSPERVSEVRSAVTRWRTQIRLLSIERRPPGRDLGR